MHVTVLRGLSGAGKTTYTKQHHPQATVASADFFFIDADGVYRYDPTHLAESHHRCFRTFMEAILRGDSDVVVDNTNICTWEYSPYVLAARSFGYTVELLTLQCTLETARARKQLIPEHSLQRINDQFIEETRNMPRRFREIHRLIYTD